MNMKPFGSLNATPEQIAQIRELREIYGWTLKKIAEEVGLKYDSVREIASRQHIYFGEKGKIGVNVKKRVIQKIELPEDLKEEYKVGKTYREYIAAEEKRTGKKVPKMRW